MAAAPDSTHASASAALAAKLAQESQRGAGADDETTPSTTASESEDDSQCYESARSCSSTNSADEETPVPKQLQAGLFDPEPPTTAPRQLEPVPLPPTSAGGEDSGSSCSRSCGPAAAPQPPCQGATQDANFSIDETFFIFDWDDTVLPSTWVQRQGLRLDAASQVSPEQREVLAEVAVAAGKTLRAARQRGTVVLVTNAERGWIELSCQKFLPTLSPMLENVKLVSARTTYEGSQSPSPLDWKLRAFDAEIARYFGPEVVSDPSKRKNVLSLGDSVHEREALLRATSSAPNCHPKSLKFVERPDIHQICKQHELITNCFDRIVHHEGSLDLCIRCP